MQIISEIMWTKDGKKGTSTLVVLALKESMMAMSV